METEVLAVSEELDEKAVTLVALTPAEMPAAQADLAAWCVRKVDALQRELAQWRTLADEAIEGGFRHTGYAASARRTEKRIVYYEKIKAAIEAGYLIVPNMPVNLFAVRVDNGRPREQRSDWHRHFPAAAKQLPAGAGRYVDDGLTVRSRSYQETTKDGKVVTKEVFFSDDYDENIDFPLRGVHPRVLSAASEAMRLRLFDELGVVQNSGGRDPIVVGRFLDPRGNGRVATFFVAWWLNTADL